MLFPSTTSMSTRGGKGIVRPWTIDEDQALVRAVRQFGEQWTRVAALIPTRNRRQCKEHWNRVLSKQLAASGNPAAPLGAGDTPSVSVAAPGPAADQDDPDTDMDHDFDDLHASSSAAAAALLAAASRSETADDPAAAAHALAVSDSEDVDPSAGAGDSGRSGLRVGLWSHDEDARLLRAYEVFGPKWVVISRHIPGRNHRQCEKRFRRIKKLIPAASLSAFASTLASASNLGSLLGYPPASAAAADGTQTSASSVSVSAASVEYRRQSIASVDHRRASTDSAFRRLSTDSAPLRQLADLGASMSHARPYAGSPLLHPPPFATQGPAAAPSPASHTSSPEPSHHPRSASPRLSSSAAAPAAAFLAPPTMTPSATPAATPRRTGIQGLLLSDSATGKTQPYPPGSTASAAPLYHHGVGRSQFAQHDNPSSSAHSSSLRPMQHSMHHHSHHPHHPHPYQHAQAHPSFPHNQHQHQRHPAALHNDRQPCPSASSPPKPSWPRDTHDERDEQHPAAHGPAASPALAARPLAQSASAPAPESASAYEYSTPSVSGSPALGGLHPMRLPSINSILPPSLRRGQPPPTVKDPMSPALPLQAVFSTRPASHSSSTLAPSSSIYGSLPKSLPDPRTMYALEHNHHNSSRSSDGKMDLWAISDHLEAMGQLRTDGYSSVYQHDERERQRAASILVGHGQPRGPSGGHTFDTVGHSAQPKRIFGDSDA